MNSINNSIEEKVLKPKSGMLMLCLLILVLIGLPIFAIYGATYFPQAWQGALAIIGSIILFIVVCIMFGGLKIVKPNEALVLTLFGKYYGTIRKDGFFYVNPFAAGFNPVPNRLGEKLGGEMFEAATKSGAEKGKNSGNITFNKRISTKTVTLNNPQQKVNDVAGNPIIIGSVVIWRITNPTKAVFTVDNYYEYLSAQCDSIIRNTTRLYPYDNMENDEEEMTLRGSSIEIAEKMKYELQEKVKEAGIEIIEVRITHLAYAEEIAGAMLKRQQATATVAARGKIVEGAVGMVRMALEQLEDDNIVLLDDERKAAMVSNLLVVLCGDKEAQPIVNSGTIY